MAKNFTYGMAAAIAIAAAAPAFAQDTGETPPFSGLYVAASGGYDVQGNDVGSRITFDRNGDGNFNDAVNTAAGANAFSPGFCNGRARDATTTTSCENDRNKASYYGRVGFDVQRGPFVLGALGEFGRTDIKDYVSGYSTTPANYVLSRGVTWEASGRLRAGLAQGNGLFYATGGIGYARLKHRFTTTNTANAFSTLLDDKDRKGFIVGGGVEYRLMKAFSIGLEYTYHDYKDDDYLIRVGQGNAPATNPFVLVPQTAGTTIGRSDENFRWHSLRGVVGFHF
jgi:outer membrane immunogenic protein